MAEPSAGNSAGGSFYSIQESASKENVRELAQWDSVQGLLTDTEIYPPELYERISGIFRSGVSGRERQDAVRDVYGDYGFRKSGDGKRGIVPGKNVADFFFEEDGFVRLSWETIAHAIGTVMEEGGYILCEPAPEEPAGDLTLAKRLADGNTDEPGAQGSTADVNAGEAGRHEEPESAMQLSLFEMPETPNPFAEDGEPGDNVITEPEAAEDGGGFRAAVNYRFSPEHHLYDGGPKEKFRNNVAAVRLLKRLQEEGRPAMAGEQVILARFVGWGGLADALTPGKAGWEEDLLYFPGYYHPYLSGAGAVRVSVRQCPGPCHGDGEFLFRAAAGDGGEPPVRGGD